MSRTLNGTTQYLSTAVPQISAVPYSMSCFFYDTIPAGANGILMFHGRNAATWYAAYLSISNAQALSCNSAENNVFRSSATATSAYSTSAWNHAAGVWASTTSRTAYLNGAAATTNTDSSNPVSGGAFSNDLIGVSYMASALGNYFEGMLAECAIWDVALTADEIALLAKGYSPLFVRPANLVSYRPLIGRFVAETDLVAPTTVTVTGATQGAHPRIFYPEDAEYGVPSSGAAAYTLAADTGSFALTGTAAALKAGRKVSAASGNFALTGTAANLLAGRRVSAGSGSFALTGQSANLLAGRKLAVDSGSFTLTGQSAGLLAGRTLPAASGSFTLTGTAASLEAGRVLPAGSGSFTLSGTTAQLRAARLLSVASGSFLLTGMDATLTYASTSNAATIPGGAWLREFVRRGFTRQQTTCGFTRTQTKRGYREGRNP